MAFLFKLNVFLVNSKSKLLNFFELQLIGKIFVQIKCVLVNIKSKLLNFFELQFIGKITSKVWLDLKVLFMYYFNLI